MSYRIEKDEALSAALRRIAAEEVTRALTELQQPNRVEAMHNTRKALKRLRSLLRTLREAFPRESFQRENRRLAGAGRKIAPLRDVHVQLQTLDKLRSNSAPVAREIARSWQRREDTYLRKIPALRRAVRQALAASQRTFAALPARFVTAAGLAAGLKRIYKQGRAGFKVAVQQKTSESLHEWRKQAKILGHSLTLIEALSPKTAGDMIKDIEELCKALGEDHDLLLVWQALQRKEAGHSARDHRRLSKRIVNKRRRLQADAIKLGRRIFNQKPRVFALQLEDWLHSAKK